ncbi:hypothetical protein DBR32_00725 [Taibaiella sp. KBW10]|uniref:hypothetical protein n=1 Tax=Taibaiella sp. KBW10 TaxID=2153357 RepID=UPI000F5A9857|nr:hypothetical protein [Taibaiella sp. KBW10]RQO32171.1 hypothetical protein DBR32_00725 [Taibaiella sp. KBW10]
MSKGKIDNELQEIWENQTFQPSEKGWLAMERALAAKPEQAPKKVPFWGVYKKAAAAILVLGLGTFSVWFINQEESVQRVSHTAQAENKQVPEPATPVAVATEGVADHEVPVVGSTVSVEKPAKGHPYFVPAMPKKEALIKPVAPVAVVPKETIIPEVLVTDSPVQTAIVHNKEAGKTTTERKSAFEPIINPEIDRKRNGNKPLEVGVLANIGKPSLGNIQYNVGVVLRKEWDNFFSEASVSMASTDIRFSENMRYGVAYGSGDMTNSEGTNAIAANTIGETQMVYGNNIFGLGIAPSIGYKIGKYVSLAVGMDVYHNFNNNLNLQYNNQVTQKKIRNVIGVKNVTNWDSGLKGQLGIHLNKAISIQTQYRQGLSNYIISESKSYKNSIINVGFIYRFQQ